MKEKIAGVIPMISYADGSSALAWLTEAFGFTEITRLQDADGTLTHAEMETGSGLVMIATPTPDYQGPKRHRETCSSAQRWSTVPWIIDGVLVYVDDVDSHYGRAKNAGALILSEPEEGPPGRRYRVEDIEGHRWMFMQAPPHNR